MNSKKMSNEVEIVDDYRAMLVKLGMGLPTARAFVAGSTAAGIAYLMKFPSVAFREDGSVKPLKYLSPEPDATTAHFLLLPVAIGLGVALFT